MDINKKINVLHFVAGFGRNAVSTIIRSIYKNLDDRIFRSVICTAYLTDGSYDDSSLRIINLGMKSFFDLSAAIKLAKIIKEGGIDIIHCHNIRPNLYGGIVGKLMGKKVVTTYHTVYSDYYENDYNKIIAFLAVKLNRILARFDDSIIAVSSNVEKYIKNIEKTSHPDIVVIHNGIENISDNFEQSDILSEIGYRSNTKLIATVAELQHRKGYEFLIDAALTVTTDHPKVLFLIIGDGPLSNTLKEKVYELKLHNNVIFTGFRTDIYNILNFVDIFVLPSVNEGLPIALLEAMNFGIPVVATRVGGVPEAVINGVTGILVEPGDPRSLAAAINRLLDNHEFARRIGEAGRKRLLEHFTDIKMSRGYEEVYFRIMNRNNGRKRTTCI